MRLYVLMLLVPTIAAQTLTVPCEPPPETLAKLEKIPPLRDDAIPYEQRIGALRRLAESNPGDFFLQRAYQDSFRHQSFMADEFDRALALYRKRGDLIGHYLEARLLMYSRPKPSRATLEQLLKEHAEFPWPHLEFVELGTLPGSRTSGETAVHRAAFERSCPDAYVAGVRGLQQEPAPMRRALERRNSRLDLSGWVALWSAEDRAGVTAEERQRRVRSDLERIEAFPFRPDPDLVFVYPEAARILKEPGVTERLRARVEKEAPDSTLAVALIREQWYAANPRPQFAPTPEAQKAMREYETKHLAVEREMLKRRPSDWNALLDLWLPLGTKIYQNDPSAASAENLPLIDAYMANREAAPEHRGEFPPREVAVAQAYVASRVRLDQVPKLLDATYSQLEKRLKYKIAAELFPAEVAAQEVDWGSITATRVQQVRAGYLLAVNRAADATEIAERALAGLAEQKPQNPQVANRVQGDTQQWLNLLARIDAEQGHTEDALAHYQMSLGWLRNKESLKQAESQQAPQLMAVKRFYLAHGGTEENWPDWATSGKMSGVVTSAPAVEFAQSLAEFSAKDLAGRTWQLRDLKGKVTLVNYWATWCGPCRGEHPMLQKLYDAIKDRKDLQVVTISVDESPSAVPEYMKEKGYTFPVLHAPELAGQLFPYVGLPTNFLVNAKGMRSGMIGFMDAESAIKRMSDVAAK